MCGGEWARACARVWAYMVLYLLSYRLELKDVCELAVGFMRVCLLFVLVVVIYRSARSLMNRFILSLPSPPSPPLPRAW